jgi:hypothetical protein
VRRAAPRSCQLRSLHLLCWTPARSSSMASLRARSRPPHLTALQATCAVQPAAVPSSFAWGPPPTGSSIAPLGGRRSTAALPHRCVSPRDGAGGLPAAALTSPRPRCPGRGARGRACVWGHLFDAEGALPLAPRAHRRLWLQWCTVCVLTPPRLAPPHRCCGAALPTNIWLSCPGAVAVPPTAGGRGGGSPPAL